MTRRAVRVQPHERPVWMRRGLLRVDRVRVRLECGAVVPRLPERVALVLQKDGLALGDVPGVFPAFPVQPFRAVLALRRFPLLDLLLPARARGHVLLLEFRELDADARGRARRRELSRRRREHRVDGALGALLPSLLLLRRALARRLLCGLLVVARVLEHLVERRLRDRVPVHGGVARRRGDGVRRENFRREFLLSRDARVRFFPRARRRVVVAVVRDVLVLGLAVHGRGVTSARGDRVALFLPPEHPLSLAFELLVLAFFDRRASIVFDRPLLLQVRLLRLLLRVSRRESLRDDPRVRLLHGRDAALRDLLFRARLGRLASKLPPRRSRGRFRASEPHAAVVDRRDALAVSDLAVKVARE
ncbi:uncharacterized protein MICPUCDRAFT_61193 [Micromonas pusilla CCMP1545]|uniref:Predicted protein n=1 Tax=Micromonas pusilla (strain CCMP1545) TaxID=564608 RepID=C1MH13_MICPC|nr:uncharacterized protein MICPUCDRAFT_61193 [Micromonas pusilla CCMP1545]EEH60124.1 predicted protein [Micromonas pusilla CCMP1545]|eukprot:XP_003054872.1 predicted protein [Micromonas pusilla CCMP1545]